MKCTYVISKSKYNYIYLNDNIWLYKVPVPSITKIRKHLTKEAINKKVWRGEWVTYKIAHSNDPDYPDPNTCLTRELRRLGEVASIKSYEI